LKEIKREERQQRAEANKQQLEEAKIKEDMKNKKVMSYTERKEEEQRQKELALEELR